mmetsp:Transcript_14032/g.45666  ORF Transcript_14032/g.45666 Transcript_14032/m.45666 type:complete len:200 (-) Transcript_14032:50-649(-)
MGVNPLVRTPYSLGMAASAACASVQASALAGRLACTRRWSARRMAETRVRWSGRKRAALDQAATVSGWPPACSASSRCLSPVATSWQLTCSTSVRPSPIMNSFTVQGPTPRTPFADASKALSTASRAPLRRAGSALSDAHLPASSSIVCALASQLGCPMSPATPAAPPEMPRSPRGKSAPPRAAHNAASAAAAVCLESR